MIKFNCRAQIDQTITGLVVLFLIFFLMSFFVLATSGVGAFLDFESSSAYHNNSDIYFDLVEVEHNGMVRDYFLFEAIAFDNREELLDGALENLYSNYLPTIEWTCSFFHKKVDDDSLVVHTYRKLLSGEVKRIASDNFAFSQFERNGEYQDFSYYDFEQDAEYIIRYYYGGCDE